VGTADLAALRAEIVALRVELAKEATSPPGGAGSGTALRAGPEED
jgi:hypothetical protein